MSLSVIPVSSRKDLKKFLMLPWKIYKGNNCWVPPLINDLKKTIDKEKNPVLEKIDFQLYLALLDNEAAGRIFVAIDNSLNQKKDLKMGYFSLFECIDNYDVAKALFDSAAQWLRDKNIAVLRGPVSPTGTDSDEYKGLLIDCFDHPPVIMNSYNPPYYKDFIEKYGFEKDYDLFAYYLEHTALFTKDPGKSIEYAQKRYNFRVDTIDFNKLEKEIKDIKYVLDLAIPDEWPDLVPPSLDEVREMAKRLMQYADPSLICIARSGDKPIGFGIALPDYNQVLIHLNGRLTPISALKYIWYKRKINWIRFFIMFVIPAFRKKGVSYAIYYKTFMNGVKNGYTHGEGSTIGETNTRMRNDIESFGGKHYKTYRIYKKAVV